MNLFRKSSGSPGRECKIVFTSDLKRGLIPALKLNDLQHTGQNRAKKGTLYFLDHEDSLSNSYSMQQGALSG